MKTATDRPGAPAGERDAETAQALRTWIALARAYNAMAQVVSTDVARHGLTPAEFGVLEALFHKGPMLLNEVQRRILVSSGGITYLVDRLEKRGLVERRDCPGDRRARFAALTEEGEALLAGIFPEHAAAIRQAMSGLGAAEKDELARLSRIVQKQGEPRAE
jgi:MarR family 2-MHQ and catechol resistance regulon transcriptional repressor